MDRRILLPALLMLISLGASGCGQRATTVSLKDKRQGKEESRRVEKQQLLSLGSTIRHTPFLSKDEEDFYAYTKQSIFIDYLDLSAIFYSRDRIKSRAVIEGQIFGEGQFIDNKKIVEIKPKEVVLEDINRDGLYRDKQYLLKLQSIVIK